MSDPVSQTKTKPTPEAKASGVTLADLRVRVEIRKVDPMANPAWENNVTIRSHHRDATVADLIAALRELGAEEIEATDKYFGTAKHPIPYMKSGWYLVFPLSNLEEQT